MGPDVLMIYVQMELLLLINSLVTSSELWWLKLDDSSDFKLSTNPETLILD